MTNPKEEENNTSFDTKELEKDNQNMVVWDRFKTPPGDALKRITGGRLGSCGFSDINAQWRLECLTSLFGPCGEGWRYSLVREWMVPAGAQGEILCFVELHLSYKMKNEEWSKVIPVYGSAFLVEKEKAGLHVNEHCLKAATTDAIGAATTKLGIAADVYKGEIEKKQKLIDAEFEKFMAFLTSVSQYYPELYKGVSVKYKPLTDLKGDNQRQVQIGNELKVAMGMEEKIKKGLA